jgi:BlaI family penicillinase repressor
MGADAVTRGLSRREREIMDILFRRGESTVAEVMEAMPEPPSYSAVRATLRILEEKGHATHREDGPRYVYLPVAAPEEARKNAVEHLVDTFFDGAVDQAVTALLRMSDVELGEAEIERLQARIRAARERGS